MDVSSGVYKATRVLSRDIEGRGTGVVCEADELLECHDKVDMCRRGLF